MAIEKSVYTAPEGLDDELVTEESAELEIEIVDPEMVTLDDGSVEITIVPDAKVTDMMDFDANLAEFLEENALNSLSQDILGQVDGDIDSRKDWADTFVKGLDVLGFKYEERSEPWEGS